MHTKHEQIRNFFYCCKVVCHSDHRYETYDQAKKSWVKECAITGLLQFVRIFPDLSQGNRNLKLGKRACGHSVIKI